MGIISTLLTGGSIIGKIFQTLKDAVTHSVNLSNGTVCVVRAGTTQLNGVRFSEVVKDGHAVLCATNTDFDSYACVTCPNGYGKMGAVHKFIPPTQTEEFSSDDWTAASPELPVYVQKVDAGTDGSEEDNRILLAFQKLPLDGTPLEIAASKLTANWRSGLEIFFPTAGLGDLVMADFSSENGVRATLRQAIPHVDVEQGTTKYDIPFDLLGFGEDDVLGGIMQFNISNDNLAKLKLKTEQRPRQNSMEEINRFLCGLYGMEKK